MLYPNMQACLRRWRSFAVGLIGALSCLACATGNRAEVTTAKTLPPSLTSNHRYHYRAIIDRSYDLSSLGHTGDTRQLKFVVEWWVSVALNQTHGDTVYFQAKVDSSKIEFQKTIPEADITLPTDLGRGMIIEGPIVLSQRDTSVRWLKASLPIGHALWVLAPDPLAARAAPVDTLYAGQRARLIDQDVEMNSLGFFLINSLDLNNGDEHIEITETSSDLQGKSHYYFDKNGILLGANLHRRIKTNTKISASIGKLVLEGLGTDSVSVNRLP